MQKVCCLKTEEAAGFKMYLKTARIGIRTDHRPGLQLQPSAPRSRGYDISDAQGLTISITFYNMQHLCSCPQRNFISYNSRNKSHYFPQTNQMIVKIVKML